MHYSPKKLFMTLTCIDIYACNIVSPNPQVHSKTIVSTYQTYHLLHKYLLKILKTKDKRQSLQKILKSWDTKTSPKRINLKICKEPKGNLDYLKIYINTDAGLQELV